MIVSFPFIATSAKIISKTPYSFSAFAVTKEASCTGSNAGTLYLGADGLWYSSASVIDRTFPTNGYYKNIAGYEVAQISNGVVISDDTCAPTVSYISVFPDTINLAQGVGTQIYVTAHMSNGSTQDVTYSASYSSNNTSRATVNSTGYITASAVNTGTVNITAVYNGHTAICYVNVEAAYIESISIDPSGFNIPLGLSEQLTVYAHWSNDTTTNITSLASYSSSNTSRATVSGGLVQASNSTTGAVNITATYDGHTAVSSGTISSAIPQSISVSPDSFSLSVSTSQQLTVTAHMSNGTTQNVTSSATYTRTNSNITVSSGGLVTGSAVGSSGVNISYSGYSTSASITVTAFIKQLVSLAVEPGIIYLSPGVYEEKTFQVRGYYNDSTNAILPVSTYYLNMVDGNIFNIGSLIANSTTMRVYQEGPPYETSGWVDFEVVYSGSEGTPTNGILSVFIG